MAELSTVALSHYETKLAGGRLTWSTIDNLRAMHSDGPREVARLRFGSPTVSRAICRRLEYSLMTVETEVLGLEVDDVSFVRKTIAFRPNRWRRLKTMTSHRAVPIWPQLEQILREYFKGANAPKSGGLLFPSSRLDEPGMVTDFRKALDVVAERAGWKQGDIRSKMFRHTYCAARLQTLDQGAPVSTFTVSKELGHGGESLVRRVYGHLGEVRHRAEVVEYRVTQHKKKLAEKLRHLRIA